VCLAISTVGRRPSSTFGTIEEGLAAKFLHFRRVAWSNIFPRCAILSSSRWCLPPKEPSFCLPL
jgi:hypothetical protein